MKSIIVKSALTAIMLIGAVCLCSAQNETQSTQELRTQINRLSHEIRTLELKENWLIWEKYIHHCEFINKESIAIYGIEFACHTVWDTLPSLGDKRREWEYHSDYISSKLGKDKLYNRLKKKLVKAKTDEERKMINDQIYEAQRYVWYYKHTDIDKIRQKNQERLCALNLETAKFLLDYYKGIDELMPTKPIPTHHMDSFKKEFDLELLSKEIDKLKQRRKQMAEQMLYGM